MAKLSFILISVKSSFGILSPLMFPFLSKAPKNRLLRINPYYPDYFGVGPVGLVTTPKLPSPLSYAKKFPGKIPFTPLP